MPIPDSIQACPLFFELFEDEIKTIVKDCRILQYEEGDIIIREGDLGEEIFVILDGSAAVEKNIKEKNERIRVQDLVVGDVFGELCLIGEKKRQADIISTDISNILEITYNNIFSLFKSNPRQFGILMLNISRLLTKRLSNSNQRLVQMNEEIKKLKDSSQK